MDSAASRTRHLIFIAHLWACAPFLVYWLAVPSARDRLPGESVRAIFAVIAVTVAYLGIRTVLAVRHPRGLRWEFVFPPIDVAIVSILIYVGDRNPLGNASLLYFFPLAEAAGTLRVAWAAAVAGMVIVGAALATGGLQSDDSFATAFRYFFILVMASLVTSLAKAAAGLREQLALARDRNRIALEMHDGVQGHLVTIASQLELAQRLARSDPDRTAEIAAQSRDSARMAADELRFMLQRLRSPSLAAGFVPALRQFAHNQTDRHGVELEFEESGLPFRLDPHAEHDLFRLAQEAITNALRHGAPSKIWVAIRFEGERVELIVKDNGTGFEGVPATGGGLEGMRSRADRLEAKLDIQGADGCRVAVSAPRSKVEGKTTHA